MFKMEDSIRTIIKLYLITVMLLRTVIESMYTVFRKKVVYFVFNVTSQLQARFSYNFQ